MPYVFGLAAAVFFGALLVASRAYRESRAERALAAMVLSIGTVHGAVHFLGWFDVLTPTALAATLIVSSFAMACAALFVRPDSSSRDLLSRATAVLRLPLDALLEAHRARSASFVALLWTYAILLWSFVLVILAPSGSWDGLWYHEPMVGFALQNHGFRALDLPLHLEWVNGYPRLSENLMLFCSAFGDRTLIDAVPHAMALTIFLAFFVLAQRFTRVRTDSMGLGCVLLTVPAVVLQLRSTYVDLSVLATFLAALHFASRPQFSARDAWLAAIAIGLVGGTKSTGIFYVAIIGLYGLVSVGRAARTRGFRLVLVHALPAFALSIALFLPTFWRNYALHENPIWPLRYHSDLLGLDFAGPHDIQNMQLPFGAVMSELFAVPVPGQDFADTRRHAFGYGLSYVALPLLLVALLQFFRDWAYGRRTATGAPVGTLLLLFFIGLLTFLSSPAFYWARYSLPFPALALVVLAAFFARRPKGMSGEGALFAMFLMNGVTLAWAEPRWDVPLMTAIDLASVDAEERVYAETSPLLFSPGARRWREEHLTRGDIVGFDDDTAFIANMWTDGFENTAIYIPFHGRTDYLDALDAEHVVWVAVRRGSTEDLALANDERWHFQEMVINDTQLYERVGRF